MRNWLLSGVSAVVCLVLLSGSPPLGQEPKEEVKKKASIWMKTKLELSRNIMGALTEGNFEEIEKNAHGLNVTGLLEALFRSKRTDYQQQVHMFFFANQELIRQAQAKNLYGATLAYNQLTTTCVQCHQIIRDAKK